MGSNEAKYLRLKNKGQTVLMMAAACRATARPPTPAKLGKYYRSRAAARLAGRLRYLPPRRH